MTQSQPGTGMNRRSVLKLAPIGVLGVGLAAANVSNASAWGGAPDWWTTEDTQWSMALFGFLGFDEIDGVYGPRTTEAVRNFQYQRNLAVDGIVGSATVDSITHVVMNVQDVVDVRMDGLAGPVTRQGVTDYQIRHGLTVTRFADYPTLAHMGKPFFRDMRGG
ncbi:peptidoglycan-binding protein [Arachnia propionica]|nr:peptidoglycan-binding protein [Arachnia propionica]